MAGDGIAASYGSTWYVDAAMHLEVLGDDAPGGNNLTLRLHCARLGTPNRVRECRASASSGFFPLDSGDLVMVTCGGHRVRLGT